MKRYLLVVFLFTLSSGYAQNVISNYKYVILPGKFSFLKEKDEYSLNSVTRTLLQDKGFTVFFDDAELPAEVASNSCRALTADLVNKSGMFTTNITLVLKDCHGNIVFKSKDGKSREKDYSTAYNLALQDAFTSLKQAPYAYNGSTNEVAAQATATTPIAPPSQEKPIAATPKKTEDALTNRPAATLYAQPIPNGYQLIDTTPKKVLTLLKTSSENYFIANNDAVNGIVLKINNEWFFEFYKDGKLISEKLMVKF